jgi:glycosyltransferase involved in cell wall biosynthesis
MASGEPTDRPAFSILVSAYKTEAYLPETIESILAQTRGDWELIVVDNGMNDEIARIVASYEDPRITLVRQENRGITGGVDAAAARATGRYYAAVDSDDMLMPRFCERTGAMLDARPEIDVVGIDAFTFEEHDHSLVRGLRHMLGMRPADPEHRLTLEDIISGNGLYYTAAIRAEAWARVGGYACDTPLAPANALFIRLVAAGCDVRVLDEKLARYRIRTDSTSTAPETKEAFEADVERSLREGAALADSPEMRRALDRRLRQIHFHQALRRARWALLARDADVAKTHAREALRQRPSLRGLLRAAVVLAGLTISPTMMRNLHPIKQKLRHLVRRIVYRLSRRTVDPA